MSKYLVTGGAGFIGSHIVEKLLKDNHSVVVLDNFSSGKEENLAFILNTQTKNVVAQFIGQTNFHLIRGDIRNFDTCLSACESVDFVLHQAALRSVPKSMENPYDYNEVNINGTLNMLKAAKEKRVKRFVFASSSSIYGDTDQFPEKESAYPLLISPYALTKLAGEYYCRIFSENYGLETVCLRYFNVFGPRQALDDEYAVVIPKFITCILSNEPPPIFGNGKQSRDFTYVDNIVAANILAATTNADVVAQFIGQKPRTFHEVLNIANGKDHSILELVGILNKITCPVRKGVSNGVGKSIKPKFKPIRPGDVFRTLADISKAKKLLGFQPKVNFEEGLRKTVAWFEVVNDKYRVGVQLG